MLPAEESILGLHASQSEQRPAPGLIHEHDMPVMQFAARKHRPPVERHLVFAHLRSALGFSSPSTPNRFFPVPPFALATHSSVVHVRQRGPSDVILVHLSEIHLS